HGAAWPSHRNDPVPLPTLRHAGGAEDPTGRTAAGRRSGDARLPVVQLVPLGDRPSPTRQASMVRQRPALSLPWLRWTRRLAHSRPGLASGWGLIDGSRG